MKSSILAALICLLFVLNVSAQYSFNAQLVQRYEYRNGYGKLMNEGQKPDDFVYQRLRIQGKFDLENVSIYGSVQDLRNWGGNTSPGTDNLLSMYEAWAELKLDTAWRIKAGKQELNYDNGRFLGNNDWSLVGRTHDFLLIKHDLGSNHFHVGTGYNFIQTPAFNSKILSNSPYKTAQFVYYRKEFNKVVAGFIFWNNGVQVFINDTIDKSVKKEIRYSQTLGVPVLRYSVGSFVISGFYYHQLGKDAANKMLNAYDVSCQVSKEIVLNSVKKSDLRFIAGFEILSGSAPLAIQNNSFTPYHGTAHIFNGYMDLFYAGGRHVNSTGLRDFYFKLRYDVNQSIFMGCNFNQFYSDKQIIVKDKNYDSNLGGELDSYGGIQIKKNIGVQIGYSQYFDSGNLAAIQNVQNPSKIQNWLYVMFVVRPANQSKFIGLLF